jgi:hypothetical protein
MDWYLLCLLAFTSIALYVIEDIIIPKYSFDGPDMDFDGVMSTDMDNTIGDDR